MTDPRGAGFSLRCSVSGLCVFLLRARAAAVLITAVLYWVGQNVRLFLSVRWLW